MFRVLIRGVLLIAGLGLLALWLDSKHFFDRVAGTMEPESAEVADSTPKTASSAYSSTFVVRKASDGHFYVDAWVNDDPVNFLVDTGASTVVLSRETAEYLGFDFWDEEFNLKVRLADGSETRGAGILLDEIVIGDTIVATNVAAIVMEEGDMDLLGQSFLNKISGYSVEGNELFLRP